MRTSFLVSSLLLAACSAQPAGGDSGLMPDDAAMRADARPDPGDAGAVDAGTVDAAAVDAGTLEDASTDDAAVPADAGADDAGRLPDAASDAASPGACGDFGRPCSGPSDCSGGYACDPLHEVCVPVGRVSCGGFAGAPCPATGYTECRYVDGRDYGPCLTPQEDACACPAVDRVFQCP